MKNISLLIHVRGLVQGVGFRPFVYRQAASLNLKGWVDNRNDGVHIAIEGSKETTGLFLKHLRELAPPASNIETIEISESAYSSYTNFEIIKSKNISDDITGVSPDIAVCPDCLSDIERQPHRINYPFINCTNCGPRFTIIKDIPYDREKTTMDIFPLCNTCYSEYTNILDRRFHAQPVACNNCGPQYELILFSELSKVRNSKLNDLQTILTRCASLISEGKIIGIKGTGGFHLACDAMNDIAVKRLRDLKHREGKPFAMMAASLEIIKEFATVSAEEETSLTSWRRPVVLLKQRPGPVIPESVSNGLGTIGVMLPYMPFHYLLFAKLNTPAIVLTSGNISDEPIVTDNNEALQKLRDVCDALLLYNRDIYNRTDDSVVFVANGKERIIRRSRGYVPNPVQLGFNAEGIFAAGAELKNCFCIGKGNQAILSQHIGDLKNIETYEFYKNTINQFLKLFRAKPALVVGDMHPDYLSTRYVNEMDVPKMFVQHHHAHIVSCMAEHHLDEKVIGVSFDGTGYGDNGNIWGGEFFVCDLNNYERISHFEYMPIPGGDKVSEEPWRMAVSYLYKVYGKEFLNLDLSFLKDIPKEKINLLLQAIDKKINCPMTSSAGRLFDAVAAITGVCTFNTFEAEAPIRLESLINSTCSEKYNYHINQSVCFDLTIKGIVEDVLNSIETSVISAKFHNTIISVILDVVKIIQEKNNLNKVVLSGGVFQNRYLLENAENILAGNKFAVYTHGKVPSNDGGIALGQLAIAAKRSSLKNNL